MLGTVHIIMYVHFWVAEKFQQLLFSIVVMLLYMCKETCNLGGVAQQTCTCDSIVACS